MKLYRAWDLFCDMQFVPSHDKIIMMMMTMMMMRRRRMFGDPKRIKAHCAKCCIYPKLDMQSQIFKGT